MIVLIGILSCLLILALVHIALKDVLAPPFVLSIVWLFAYFMLLIFKSGSIPLKSIYYLSFVVSLIFFSFGFFAIIRNNSKQKNNFTSPRISEFRFKLPYIQIFLLTFIILTIIYFFKVFTYVQSENEYNFWHTLTVGLKDGSFHLPTIMEYSTSPVIALNIICTIVFFSNPSIRNKRYFYISTILAGFYAVTSGNRGTVFLWLIALTISFLIVRNYDNIKLIKVLSKLSVIILVIFIISNFAKYVYSDQSDAIEFSKTLINHYFSSSTIAFVEWMKTNNDYFYGANTFRFFLAVFDSIGFNTDVPNLIQQEIEIYGDKTNIYTILQYYAKDFGLFYAFFIQLIIGMGYGVLYSRAVLTKKIRPFSVAILSMLYFPLVNQFFDDKYFSLLSTWIQMLFWIWVFTRKKILIENIKGP